MERTQVRLYNILLPIWLLWIFPQAWLVILPGNLAIDCAVLLLALAALRIPPKGRRSAGCGGGSGSTASWPTGRGWHGWCWACFRRLRRGWWAENLTPITGSPFRTPLALVDAAGVAVAGCASGFWIGALGAVQN